MMTLDFWNDHSILFFLALIFIPRMTMIYMGLVTPYSVGAIIGLSFVPRMMIASSFTAIYGTSNPTMIVILWIIAVVGDIVDTILIKGSISYSSYKHYIENYPPPWQNRYWLKKIDLNAPWVFYILGFFLLLFVSRFLESARCFYMICINI